MFTIAISNSKGGTGKTTTTRELGFYLSKSYKVLLIDLDSQMSLSHSVKFDETHSFSIVQVLNGQKTLGQVINSVTKNLDIVTANIELNSTENELRAKPAGAYTLQKAIAKLGNTYDLVLIDTVGSASQLVVSALVAAHALIIPTRPEGTDLRALAQFLELVNEVKELPAINLSKIGILPTQFIAKTNHHEEAVEAMKQLRYKVFTPIGRSTKVGEAMHEKKPLEEWAKDNPRNTEYAQVAKEVITWLKQ